MPRKNVNDEAEPVSRSTDPDILTSPFKFPDVVLLPLVGIAGFEPTHAAARNARAKTGTAFRICVIMHLISRDGLRS